MCLTSILFIPFFLRIFIIIIVLLAVEDVIRNGYKTTKAQLNISINKIKNRIDVTTKPLLKHIDNIVAHLSSSSWSQQQRFSFNLIDSNIVKLITLYRQCERFIYDVLSTFMDNYVQIDRFLKKFRNQLNEIHEIVKFRTAIPITNVFVSIQYVLHLFTFLTPFFRSIFRLQCIFFRTQIIYIYSIYTYYFVFISSMGESQKKTI